MISVFFVVVFFGGWVGAGDGEWAIGGTFVIYKSA